MQDADIYGFALQQVAMNPETPADLGAVGALKMVEYEAAADRLPAPRALVGGHVANVCYDYDP